MCLSNSTCLPDDCHTVSWCSIYLLNFVGFVRFGSLMQLCMCLFGKRKISNWLIHRWHMNESRKRLCYLLTTFYAQLLYLYNVLNIICVVFVQEFTPDGKSIGILHSLTQFHTNHSTLRQIYIYIVYTYILGCVVFCVRIPFDVTDNNRCNIYASRTHWHIVHCWWTLRRPLIMCLCLCLCNMAMPIRIDIFIYCVYCRGRRQRDIVDAKCAMPLMGWMKYYKLNEISLTI